MSSEKEDAGAAAPPAVDPAVDEQSDEETLAGEVRHDTAQ